MNIIQIYVLNKSIQCHRKGERFKFLLFKKVAGVNKTV
jgi:hypothetical protein